MARDYPRYAGKIQLGGKLKAFPPKCACCGQSACGFADVRFTWFRSDDVAYPVCEIHRGMASRDLPAFLAALPAQQHNEQP